MIIIPIEERKDGKKTIMKYLYIMFVHSGNVVLCLHIILQKRKENYQKILSTNAN